MATSLDRRQFSKSILSVLLTSLIPPWARAASDSDTVKIGFAAQTEGPALHDGRAYTRAFQTALDYVNSQGGIIGGKKVEGVAVSQGLSGETARSAAMRLAQRDQVKALIGPMYSDSAAAGLGVAQRYNLVFAPDQGGMWLYQQGYQGTLGLSCNARARTMPQVRWIESRGYKSVVLLLSDIDYSRDVERLVKDAWEKPGSKVKLASVIYYPYGQTELQGELTKAMGLKPDFIWSEDWSAPVAISVMKICRDLHFQGGLSITCSIDQQIIDPVPKEVSEGVFSHMDYAPDPTVPENKAFIDLWQKKWGAGTLPFRTEEVIFSQTVFLLKAMDKAGTPGDGTPSGLKKIHDAMRQLDWTSPRGSKVVLTASGLGLFPFTPMTQIKGGKITVIEKLPMTPNDYLSALPTDWKSL